MNDKKEVGKIGEDMASNYLLQNHYSILQRNFFSHHEEIDIIAYDSQAEEIVFLEVKTRFQNEFGSPVDAVDERKVKHLYRVAKYFLMLHHLENECIRFDVIEILRNHPHKIYLHHIKNVILEEPS